MNLSKMVANKRGLSLIEVLLIATLITLIVAALINLGILSLRTSDQGRNEGIATELTREAIEQARVERDADSTIFFDFVNTNGDGYYALSGSNFTRVNVTESQATPPNFNSSFGVTGYTNFYRVVYFELVGVPKATLQLWVKTYWRQPTGAYSSVESATILTKWR